MSFGFTQKRKVKETWHHNLTYCETAEEELFSEALFEDNLEPRYRN
jgi:hypothetical protein